MVLAGRWERRRRHPPWSAVSSSVAELEPCLLEEEDDEAGVVALKELADEGRVSEEVFDIAHMGDDHELVGSFSRAAMASILRVYSMSKQH